MGLPIGPQVLLHFLLEMRSMERGIYLSHCHALFFSRPNTFFL